MQALLVIVVGGLLLVVIGQSLLLVRMSRSLRPGQETSGDLADHLVALGDRLETRGAKADLKRGEIARLQAETRRQVEALLNLHALFAPRSTMPSTQGWAATPMTVQELVRLVLEHQPEVVVECGSGGSSVWVGYALEKVGRGKCIALEHDPAYAARTRADLERHGLSHIVEVRDAPLVDVSIGDASYPWYDPTAIDDVEGIGVVFVDGPPGDSGPLARFPALPVLGAKCLTGAVFLLDDASRQDERRLVARWVEEYSATVIGAESTDTGWCAVDLGPATSPPAGSTVPEQRREHRETFTPTAP